ncbi:MAG: hypothetical protein MUO53_02580 [Maribacter sp.]|nr:hypothetical protein [Maribacter sp.]
MEPKTFLKRLQIVHWCFVVALLGSTIFVYRDSTGFRVGMSEVKDIFLFIVPLVALFGYFGSQLIFRNQLRHIALTESLDSKLKKYRTASLIKYSLLEVPSFLALYAFYTTDIALYFVIAICLIAYLFVQGPKKSRLINEMPLCLEEKELFDTLQT